MEVEGEKIDLDDINNAYQQDLDVDGVKDDNTDEAE